MYTVYIIISYYLITAYREREEKRERERDRWRDKERENWISKCMYLY